VQLLCLIGKSLDACRYLQSYDRWTDAAWLAKISLGENDCGTILKRWAQFLSSTDQRMKAVNILLTLGEFDEVLQLLHSANSSDTAALFSQALQEQHIELNSSVIEQEQLQKFINAEYGLFLNRIGNKTAAEFYFKRAGKGNSEEVGEGEQARVY